MCDVVLESDGNEKGIHIRVNSTAVSQLAPVKGLLIHTMQLTLTLWTHVFCICVLAILVSDLEGFSRSSEGMNVAHLTRV